MYKKAIKCPETGDIVLYPVCLECDKRKICKIRKQGKGR